MVINTNGPEATAAVLLGIKSLISEPWEVSGLLPSLHVVFLNDVVHTHLPNKFIRGYEYTIRFGLILLPCLTKWNLVQMKSQSPKAEFQQQQVGQIGKGWTPSQALEQALHTTS